MNKKSAKGKNNLRRNKKMINQENLDKLYATAIDSLELTTSELTACGFNSRDIASLIEQNKIKRNKKGHYSFFDIDDLYLYGQKLADVKNFNKSDKCFEVCYQLNPKHLGTNYRLFYGSIVRKDYQRAFKYFDTIWKTENSYFIRDNKFYLFLLSLITEVPSKYKDELKAIKLEDIRADCYDQRYSDIFLENALRRYAYNLKTYNALQIMKRMEDAKKLYIPQDIIAKKLLIHRLEKDQRDRKTLLTLAAGKRYQEIVSFLENKEEHFGLNMNDKYLLIIATKIVEIQETNKVPEPTILVTNKIAEAIAGSNFALALDLSEAFNEKNGINNSSYIINLLLHDICALIKKVKPLDNEKIENVKTDENINLPKAKLDENNNREIKNENKAEKVTAEDNISSAVFSDIVMALMLGNSCDAQKRVKDYLDSINKSEYEYLIVDLIKLSLLKKDFAFIEPMTVLAIINKDDFNLDVSKYLQEFYINIYAKKFEEAAVYLDILTKSNKISKNIVEGLQNVLNISASQADSLDSKVKETTLDLPDNKILTPKAEEVTTSLKTVSEISKENEETKQPLKTRVNESTTLNTEMDSTERSFIDRQHQLLLERKGVVVLKFMDKAKRERIYEIVKNYDDMVAFSIGDGEQKQIVLRYKTKGYKQLDVSKLLRIGREDYYNLDYEGTIEKYLQVLSILENPKAFIYAMIGLAYLKKFQMERAVDYLTIATAKSIYEKDDQYDFSNIIASINGKRKRNWTKPNFEMDIQEFEKERPYDLMVIDIEKIKAYILESGLDVESACQNLGLSTEETDIVILSLAAEYYTQGDYRKGDQFLNAAEKSPNKTKNTIKLLETVKLNKKFYANRAYEGMSCLSLTLQPRKK